MTQIQLFWQIVILSGSYLSLLCLQNTQTVQNVTRGWGVVGIACYTGRYPSDIALLSHALLLRRDTIVTYLCSWKMLRRVQFWKEVVYREGRASTTPVRIMCNTGAAQQKPYKIYRGLLNFEWNFFFNIKLCLTLVFIIYCEEFFWLVDR